MKTKHIIVTTGTNIEKCERIFAGKSAYYVKRSYLTDVLGGRDNAVAIDWHVLNNAGMLQEGIGYGVEEMENFSAMCEVENGKLFGELWFSDVIKYLFINELPMTGAINRQARRQLRNHNLINLDAATIIFTAGTKETHRALKELIEKVLPGYLVYILNGDETTNAKAEAEARQAIKDYGTKVIFIAGVMANRSFSVPEIKNVILFCNACDPAQKIARGLTPWAGHEATHCNIIDFRLSYTQTNCEAYLSGCAMDTLSDNATKASPREILEVIRATDKLSFDEYFYAGIEPIHKLTDNDLVAQMESADYLRAHATKVVVEGIDGVAQPDSKFAKLAEKLNFNDLTNPNVKGDNNKKVYVNGTIKSKTSKTKKELSEDQRLHYLAYLLNHKEVFNTYTYTENILENEFKHNMSEARKATLETYFNIDMNVMMQIADLLIKSNIKIYN